MKSTNTEHMIAKCGHHDILGYLLDTYCKGCADKGHREVVRPQTRIWTDDKVDDKVNV
jgi:hypothetical protein